MTRHLFCIPLAIAAAVALAGCDPNKSGDKGGEGGSAVSSTTSASSSTSGAAGSPTAGSAPSPAAAAFAKPRKASGAILIKLITNGNSPFWDSMGQGLSVGIKAVGADPGSGWSAPAGTDNASQKNLFDQDVSANADGIAVSTIDAKAFVPVINSAVDKGIPVITFDSDSPDSERLAYIGTNNYNAGRAMGEAAIKLFPNGGSLVAFVGNMSADNARQRYQGFLDAVKGHNINMLQDPYEDDKDAVGRAHQNVSDAITKYGSKLNGLLGLYSYNGPAIVDEVKKAGLLGKVRVLCFDGEPRTLDNLRHGLVDVTVVQKPYEFGRLSAELLFYINRLGLDAAFAKLDPELTKLGMKRDGSIIDTGVEVVTPANAAPFLKELQEKGLTST